MIQLVGPGGAGKTTAGAALADRLGIRFVDLDAEFAASNGDISAYLDTHGYDAYAERNVSLYSALIGEPDRPRSSHYRRVSLRTATIFIPTISVAPTNYIERVDLRASPVA